MTCPFCGATSTKVVDSRVAGSGIRRRRECPACSKRFTTYEQAEHRMPTVVKKSGVREAFSRDKVLDGLTLACRKRPVPVEHLESATDRIASRLLALGEREVQAQRVGQLVLEELLALDRVAYLRFASVYQELRSPEEFLELLQPLLGTER